MYEDKFKVKFISRKVIIAWKNAIESSSLSWQEIFPVICALYELDDNFHKDEAFQNLKIESMPFYAHFKEILKELNLANFNIHYFRKLTKHLLKIYLETNKEIRQIQEKKIATGQELTSNDIVIPNELIDELVCLYKELKKADINESDPQISRGVPTFSYHRRSRSGQYSKNSLKTEIGQGYEDERESISSEKLFKPRRVISTIPKLNGNISSLSSNVSPRLISGVPSKFTPCVSSKQVPVKGISGAINVSPKILSGTTPPKTSPLISPILSPLISPTLSPPMYYNDNVSMSYKKFTPPANANVITIKHPKKSNLRKIKRKSLKVATNNYNSTIEQELVSPTESFSNFSRISPLSLSKLEDDFNITSLSRDEVPKVVNYPLPHKFMEYPTRTASLSPSSQKRMSFPKRSQSQQNEHSENYSFISNPSNVSSSRNFVSKSPSMVSNNSFTQSQKLAPFIQSNQTSDTFNSMAFFDEERDSRNGSKRRSRAHSMSALAYQSQNNIFKMSPSSGYRNIISPEFLPFEESLPAIPSINNNYIEDIVSPKMNNPVVYEEPISPSIRSPISPPLTQYPSPNQSFSQMHYPAQSPQMQLQALNTSFTSLNTSIMNDDENLYDFSDILDRYADNEVISKTSPILANNSPHFSLFSNNNLTQEGAIYAKSTSIKSVETLGFLDVPGIEGIPKFEEREASFLEKYSINKSEMDSQLEEPGHISTVITDSSVIDGLESDLLNHKVQARKSIGSINSSLKCTPLKNDLVLTSIDEEKDEENKSTSEINKEKENKTEEEKVKDDIEMPDDLKEKKQQFRLSFLTSKSSNSSLKKNLKKQEEDSKLKEEIQIVGEEEGSSTTKKSENDNDSETRKNNSSSPKSSDTGSQSPKTSTPYFVHPAQLYHMLQIFCNYFIAGFPQRAQSITHRWINTSNSLALNFWKLLKYKEETISQIIIYATFYDQVKSRAFPLRDPDHVFLKELISSINVDNPTSYHEEMQTKKTRRNRNRSISDPYLPQKFKGTGNGIFKTIENQMSNQKLIMQIKKELLI
ncbi:hypothetical protein BCR36DRAFT_416014 [Piromyces finnis]|uniref:Uncharacterized protein n=1 Tax=Piromyces finnis TaxID=1754191 RepID=A0A1Y1UXR2_9FUNG|nr:hypothetical protein BCR36DRAFT_416014 [Piromyces finnis]|eukprot:ORX42523.1 hypothetical protein BCR36DRAFT_416014 [Piromyces finnis]